MGMSGSDYVLTRTLVIALLLAVLLTVVVAPALVSVFRRKVTVSMKRTARSSSHPDGPSRRRDGQRLAITGISGFATPAESEVAPSTEARGVPSTPRKHRVRPRFSTGSALHRHRPVAREPGM
jgi:hypothetical protein